jgi:Na+-driven multidrug efflux pump
MMGLIDSNRRFLQNMDYQRAPMWIQLVVTLFHIPLCFWLTSELGVQGTGLATVLSNLLSLLGHAGFTTYFTGERVRGQAWFLPFKQEVRAECFDLAGLRQYARLGLSSIGMLSLEWWSYELMMVFAAKLSVAASAT